MELRHLRYFVAIAEERSFVHGARRLRVAQPALSKQIRALETELGVILFDRLPRGVQLTPAGAAFLADARVTLDAAGRAVANARAAAKAVGSVIEFAHGELSVYATVVEDLLAAFQDSHPQVQVRVSTSSDADAYDALRERRIDVACVFIAEWPVAGFDAYRLVDCTTKGVLLPAHHPLAAKPSLHLQELGALAWLNSAPHRWPGFFRTFQDALRARGLVPQRLRDRPAQTPTANVQIATGEAWALASEAVAAPYRTAPTAIAYRPFVEPPIPCWLALVWRRDAPCIVHGLVNVARALAGVV